MPFVGEQPKSSGTVKVFGRASTIDIDVLAGIFTIATRSGSISIGVT
jgi:hypothetical protein